MPHSSSPEPENEYSPDARARNEPTHEFAIQPKPLAAPGEPFLSWLTPSDNPEHLGRLGRYEIVQVIGRGGMGVMFRALDTVLQRVVALKVPNPESLASPVARERFLREARAAAAISHEHVVGIYAAEEASGLPHLAMQYVSGQSLEQRLATSGPLEHEETVRIARQTAAGLAAVHAQGLIHRDLKPANILLDDGSGHVRITDFGLVRGMQNRGLTQAGLVVGTPQYMSPEQIGGGAVDHRSDLYSLGLILYKMATGHEPFESESISALWTQHLYLRPPQPSEVAPGRVPVWLERLILRLLQKDPAARPQTAEEVIQSLDRGSQSAALPGDEQARLATLRRYRILDTDPEQAFDDLTFLASYLCGTPIALITLVDEDRQWFKSKIGLSLRETARNVSFCTHAIQGSDLFLVPDAQKDERFRGNPLVQSDPHIRFYAGMPLLTPDGHALGTICVIDRVPRQLSTDQAAALAALSRLTQTHLELRQHLLELRDVVGEGKLTPVVETAP